jgi:hypothetical protein
MSFPYLIWAFVILHTRKEAPVRPLPYLISSCICFPAEIKMVGLTANKHASQLKNLRGGTNCTPGFMQLGLRLFDSRALNHDLQIDCRRRAGQACKAQGNQRSLTHCRTRALHLRRL